MGLLIPDAPRGKMLYGILACQDFLYHHTKFERSVSIDFRDTEGPQNLMWGCWSPDAP